ncbi:ABC transporter substrate-binding protein [Microlunatus sp. GCM10028923]|uniref:ABC transporter substrate-binding protein n=1 Tax=Microlunatus sp. GCM10028923 TaxID=3273400 RepID=UPI0036085CA5
MKRLTRFGLGLCIALVLAVTACTGPATETPGAPGTGSGSASGGGTVNIYLYQEPAGIFGPLAPASGPDGQVNSLIFQGLLGADPNFELQPILADSYEISPDAKTFTFKLKPGLKWNDGEPLTSADVLFTYNAVANPKAKSAAASMFSSIVGAKEVTDGKADTVSGITAPDDQTVVVKTAEPNFGLLAQIGPTWIMPKHVLGDIPIGELYDNEFFRKPEVTSGPFKFVEYKTSQYVHVVANENATPKPKLSEVYLKPMTSDVATAALGNGELDVATVSPLDLETIKGFDQVAVQEKLGAGFVRLGLNQSRDHFKDERVRQAFLYATNRADLVQKVLLGKAVVQNSDFYTPRAPKDLNEYAYDPAKAKQLLADAGWDSSKEIDLMWVPGQRDRDASATIVQSQLKEVGVNVKLRQVQPSEISKIYGDKDFDMVLYGGGNYAISSDNVSVITSCAKHYPNGGNINYFCDPALDKIMKEANGTVDETKRNELYAQAAKISNEKADLFWLYSPMGLWAVNKRVQGFQAPGSQEVPFWDPASWSISGQ